MSKLWSRLLPTFFQKQKDPRTLQFEMDQERLLSLIRQRGLTFGKEANLRKTEKLSQPDKFFEAEINSQVLALLKTFKSYAQEKIQNYPTEEGLETQPMAASLPSNHRISGLSFAVRSSAPDSGSSSKALDVCSSQFRMSEIASGIRNQVGFALKISSSTVLHSEAGDGLFLEGKAAVGSVVAFYPGVVYLPSQLQHLPGYPRVETDNPYLISRFDGAIIDGRPWGRGGNGLEKWSGLKDEDLEWYLMRRKEGEIKRKRSDIASFIGSALALNKTKKEIASDVAQTETYIERRNCWAFGHFANHPPQGVTPNVMVCPYDFITGPETRDLRPLVPNVQFRAATNDELSVRRKGILWVKDGSGRKNSESIERPASVAGTSAVVRCLLLVTTRDVCDEELLLNYRLSSPFGAPAWYHPVDAEEDKRRWAT